MENRWLKGEAARFIAEYGERYGEDLALRTYTSRLIGAEKGLVLHGGGNTSVKGSYTNILGNPVPAIFVKVSGCDLASIEPEGHLALNLKHLQQLQALTELSDESMVNELRTNLLYAEDAVPSVETLMHAFITSKYLDHTHADSILALTNQPDAEKIIRDALGSEVLVLEYVKPGFALAKAAAVAFESSPESEGMVLLKHGLLTWGNTARESYERTIGLASRAEEYLLRKRKKKLQAKAVTSTSVAGERYVKVAPMLRGSLALPTRNPDWPYERFVLQALITDEVLNLVDSSWGKQVALTPPLTSDHLIRTKALPMWIDAPQYDDADRLREQISVAVSDYAKQYDAYFEKHSRRVKVGLSRFDSMPRAILMPGLGAICVGENALEARIVRDIIEHTLRAKTRIAEVGSYEGLSEADLFDMEYFSLQHAKLGRGEKPILSRSVAMITGAAGAIGSGISRELLEEGCHVAVTDLPGDSMISLVDHLKQSYADRVIAVPLDVTDPKSVAEGFEQVIQAWGGIDIVIVNAGIAHVSSLEEMDPGIFEKLERVNVEGTLHVLTQAARCFKIQATGGDIVLISTKNVTAPGAKFGAYSATKAAAHQLARIASLELAGIDVRVNMIAPDAVFEHEGRKSGLWVEVGPERMRARGVDEKGLEEYYRNRNLLKAKITATHVGKAVLFFATRQTPTTGATIPVDGGLPDATPR